MVRSKYKVILIAACNIMLIHLMCDPCFGIPKIAISTLEETAASKGAAIEKIELLSRSDLICPKIAVIHFANRQTKILIRHSDAVNLRLHKLCIENHIPLHGVCILDALKPLMTIIWLLCLPFMGFAVRRAERQEAAAF